MFLGGCGELAGLEGVEDLEVDETSSLGVCEAVWACTTLSVCSTKLVEGVV